MNVFGVTADGVCDEVFFGEFGLLFEGGHITDILGNNDKAQRENAMQEWRAEELGCTPRK